MSIERGYIIGISKKHNINTQSSTKIEVLGANEGMPTILWRKYFLEVQGCNIADSIFYQDKKSAILLENNVKISCR